MGNGTATGNNCSAQRVTAPGNTDIVAAPVKGVLTMAPSKKREGVISRHLDMLFPEMAVIDCELFRVTRNANTERDEEQTYDLLAI